MARLVRDSTKLSPTPRRSWATIRSLPKVVLGTGPEGMLQVVDPESRRFRIGDALARVRYRSRVPGKANVTAPQPAQGAAQSIAFEFDRTRCYFTSLTSASNNWRSEADGPLTAKSGHPTSGRQCLLSTLNGH